MDSAKQIVVKTMTPEKRAIAIITVLLLPLSDRLSFSAESLFVRENLHAWCIVPYDGKQRTPEQRAAMLARLGIRRFAYDWRSEHSTSGSSTTSIGHTPSWSGSRRRWR